MSHNQEATPDTSVLASPLPAPTQTSFFRPNTDTPVKLGSGVRSIADSELCPLNSFETPGGASFRYAMGTPWQVWRAESQDSLSKPGSLETCCYPSKWVMHCKATFLFNENSNFLFIFVALRVVHTLHKPLPEVSSCLILGLC